MLTARTYLSNIVLIHHLMQTTDELMDLPDPRFPDSLCNLEAFRRTVESLEEPVDEHADKLFRQQRDEVFDLLKVRRGAVIRWEKDMLCRAKEEVYQRNPRFHNARFDTLRKSVDSFTLMQHFRLVSWVVFKRTKGGTKGCLD
jgi:hypothetical protein